MNIESICVFSKRSIRLAMYHDKVNNFVLRYKYDAAAKEDKFVALLCNELVSSFVPHVYFFGVIKTY